ncbi:DNA polymerase III subunit chi [Mariprofundus ferrooxydans]|nr:DNA polymerase III subunit chi [Mariprofundus ferrooxydans]
MDKQNTEPKVHFELLAQADRIKGIANLLFRRNRLTPHVLILCPDEDLMQQLDKLLWTIHPQAFLPHAIATDDVEHNAKQPVLLATNMNRDNQATVLINAGLEVPPELQGFSHIVDFVDGWDEDLKQASRERFKTYQQLSLHPTYIGKK